MRKHRNPRPRLPKPPTHDNQTATKRPPPRTSAEFDGHVNELRDALGRVDALTDSLKRTFDQRLPANQTTTPSIGARRS